jgi:hypothetical protein
MENNRHGRRHRRSQAPLPADGAEHYREELARLTEENIALRRSALTFGRLAERLHVALEEERRLAREAVRVVPKPDRRKSPARSDNDTAGE